MMYRRTSSFDDMFDLLRNFDSLFRRALEEFRPLSGEMTGRALPPAIAAGDQVLPAGSETGLLPSWGAGRTLSFFPAVESFSRDKDLVLRVELPGVSPTDVEVSLTGNQLTIRGEKKAHRETEEGGVHLQETAHGRFARTFSLPEGIKADQVKASCTNGVLEILLPSEAQQTARKVPIEVGDAGRKSIKAA
ncbi:MAG TPA: Hsp20/alpha crystallin family protein [Candidatus Polarisedimenticolia bacterium]|nr:Hsp20/alpha crystallin family protein [Candidatus Polarisedimenticolia bacterium]